MESLITILTARFIPFFMILWIIGMNWLCTRFLFSHLNDAVDVSVCIFPIDVLPHVYHYGYAAPFYNISRSTRSIVFGTKNTRKSFCLHHLACCQDLFKLVVVQFCRILAYSLCGSPFLVLLCRCSSGLSDGVKKGESKNRCWMRWKGIVLNSQANVILYCSLKFDYITTIFNVFKKFRRRKFHHLRHSPLIDPRLAGAAEKHLTNKNFPNVAVHEYPINHSPNGAWTLLTSRVFGEFGGLKV